MFAYLFSTPTVPGLPRSSPIQVLTRRDPALLPRSDKIWHVQGGVAVGLEFIRTNQKTHVEARLQQTGKNASQNDSL